METTLPVDDCAPAARHSPLASSSPRVLEVMEATILGTKRHLHELSISLRAAGWDLEVACPRVRDEAHGDNSFWDDLCAAGVPVHEVTMRRTPLRAANATAIFRLAALLCRGRYSIVHAHSSIAGAVARLAALLCLLVCGRRPRVVYTPHGFAFLAPGQRRQHFFLAVERALGHVTDRLIAVSATEAESATSHGIVPPHRLATIPNGLRADQLPSAARAAEVRRRQGWDTPIVGTIARLTPQKDPTTWLRTAAHLARVRPDIRFIWIGGGELEEATRAQASQLGLEGRLQFLGYRSDARDLLAAFDVFLLTSVFEGLPYSIMEALACGVPVVATDVVGTRDVVHNGETGLLAPAGAASALAVHALRLLDDIPAARHLAEAGRRDVLTRFSITHMVERTAALYRSLA